MTKWDGLPLGILIIGVIGLLAGNHAIPLVAFGFAIGVETQNLWQKYGK